MIQAFPFFPSTGPFYQIDELNHCLASLSASLSERGWVNMLPMHESPCMGRAIVPRVRQVVNCLLFPHYLSVTWTHRGAGNSPSFHWARDEQIVLTGCSLVYDTGHQSIHLRPRSLFSPAHPAPIMRLVNESLYFSWHHPSWPFSGLLLRHMRHHKQADEVRNREFVGIHKCSPIGKQY